MTETNDRALVPLAEVRPTYKTLQMLATTPTIPERYRESQTPVQDMFAASLHGQELGVGTMTAINELYLVNGTVSMSAKLMSALIHRAGHVLKVKVTADAAVVMPYRWHEQTETLIELPEFEFTTEDAKRAGLDEKDTYKEYPKSMLANRAITQVARIHFADVIHGIGYVPEEVDASDHVDPIPEQIEVVTDELEAEEVAAELDGEVVDDD